MNFKKSYVKKLYRDIFSLLVYYFELILLLINLNISEINVRIARTIRGPTSIYLDGSCQTD